MKRSWILVVVGVGACFGRLVIGGPLDQWQVVTELNVAGGKDQLAYGNGTFVMSSPHVPTSTNALDWVDHAEQILPIPSREVAFGSGRFVVPASDSLVDSTFESADGQRWEDLYFGIGDPKSPFCGRGRLWLIGGDYDQGMGLFSMFSGRPWEFYAAFDWPFMPRNPYPERIEAARGIFLGYFVTAASDGSRNMVLSEDGRTWTVLSTEMLGTVHALAYGGGVFVAYATDRGLDPPQAGLFTSEDGTTWVRRLSPLSGLTGLDYLSGLTYGNKTFVGVGSSGRVLTSEDGIQWTERSLGPELAGDEFTSVVFGQGRFVASGQRTIASAVMPPAVEKVRMVPRLCWPLADGTMLLTVEGPYGQPVYVEGSEDLEKWEVIATDQCDRGEFEVYDEGAADLPHRFYRATQGEPPPPPPPDDPLMNWSVADTVLEDGREFFRWRLAYGNGVFVAAGRENDNTSGSAWYSENGLTWQPSNSTEPHQNLAFGAGRFASWAGELPLSTVDGQEWTEHDPVGVVVDGQVGFGRGRFGCLAPGPSDQQGLDRTWFVTSSDGVHWETNMMPVLPVLEEIQRSRGGSVAYAKGRMVFLDSWKIISTADGVNWDVGPSFPPDPWTGGAPVLYSMFYGHGHFIATGDDLLPTSEDGVSWVYEEYRSPQPSLPTYANGTFVAEWWNSSRRVSQVYGSADGLTWTNLVEVQTGSAPSDLLFAEGRFHFVTREGQVWRSGRVPPHVTEPRVIPERTYRLPDGAMLVTVEAPYGHEVVVEGSEDMETWQEIGRDPCDRGEFEIYHETAPPGTNWFYRARQVER